MFDSADPLSGWALEDIEATSSGQATADLYGKFCKHINNTLKSFLHRLDSLHAADLTLMHVDAVKLPDFLGGSERFDRIEVISSDIRASYQTCRTMLTYSNDRQVSNISDCGYIGPFQTVGLLSPLLQSHAMNPHATLITLFMNAVDEIKTKQDQILEMSSSSLALKTLIKYMPPTGRSASKNDPAIMKLSSSVDYVASHDRYFNQ